MCVQIVYISLFQALTKILSSVTVYSGFRVQKETVSLAHDSRRRNSVLVNVVSERVKKQ